MQKYLSSITKQTMDWRNRGKNTFGATCLAVWWKARINKGHLLKMNLRSYLKTAWDLKCTNSQQAARAFSHSVFNCVSGCSINSGKKKHVTWTTSASWIDMSAYLGVHLQQPSTRTPWQVKIQEHLFDVVLRCLRTMGKQTPLCKKSCLN